MYNPTTKREIIRGTFKTIGPIRPAMDRATYNIDEEDNVTELPPTISEPSSDVNDYKFLINSMLVDPDNLELYRTVDVVAE